MSHKNPRFGVWIEVHGNWIYTPPEEKQDASFARVKHQILSAENAGYDTALVANFLQNPRTDQWEQLEAWTGAAALAAITKRIEIIAAIKPLLLHPAVFAKIALGIEDISEGRFAINVVNGWFIQELEKSGIGFPPHDERYEYGREWLEVWRRLVSGERVTYQGKHFQLEDYAVAPLSRHRARPVIYSGGESEQGRDLAVAEADTWFLHAGPPEDIQAIIDDVSQRPRQGPALRYGLSAFGIARSTDQEAADYKQELIRLIQRPGQPERQAKHDPKTAMHKRTASYRNKGGEFFGAAAGLVGSYDTVAERIVEFQEIGIETFMLMFHPFVPEQELFAAEVFPRVWALNKRKSSLVAA